MLLTATPPATFIPLESAVTPRRLACRHAAPLRHAGPHLPNLATFQNGQPLYFGNFFFFLLLRVTFMSRQATGRSARLNDHAQIHPHLAGFHIWQPPKFGNQVSFPTPSTRHHSCTTCRLWLRNHLIARPLHALMLSSPPSRRLQASRLTCLQP